MLAQYLTKLEKLLRQTLLFYKNFEEELSMTKKKISIMARLPWFSCLVLVGGAYAYFTDSVTTSASFTAAKVDISKLPANKTFTVGNMATGVWRDPKGLISTTPAPPFPVKIPDYRRCQFRIGCRIRRQNLCPCPPYLCRNPERRQLPIVYEGKLSNLYINSATTPGVIETSWASI
jgi:predicted ribosomally synthesized peptide with SipW-like signal peptide